MYDPGQGLPMFEKSEVLNFIDQAEWIILNEYEANLLSEITGLNQNEINAKVSAMIVTKGGQGSDIFVEDQVISIDPISVENEADPTGCGDAYRAGLIYGMTNNLGWEKSGKLGSMLGSIKSSIPWDPESCIRTRRASLEIIKPFSLLSLLC